MKKRRQIKEVQLVTTGGVKAYRLGDQLSSGHDIDNIEEVPADEEYPRGAFELCDEVRGLIGYIDKACPHTCLYYVYLENEDYFNE